MPKVIRLDERRSKKLGPQERQMHDTILRREVQQRSWYHRIDLGNGLITPGLPWDDLWNLTRSMRDDIDYQKTCVLDLGSWDGLWAFEAEALGSQLVVASDCMNYWQIPWHQGMENFLLVREALFSKVVPVWNVPLNKLRERLDNLIYSHPSLKDGFDIVQHLGLLYHLRDPMYSLAQARSVLKDGGILLLETAVVAGSNECAMFFNKDRKAIYDDFTTWWAPTVDCLYEMLKTSLFKLVKHCALPVDIKSPTVTRLALVAEAIAPSTDAFQRYHLDPSYDQGFSNKLIERVPYNDPSSPDSLEAYYRRRFPGQ